MKHKLFTIISLVVIFVITLPSGILTTLAQSTAVNIESNAAFETNNIVVLPLVLNNNEFIPPVIPETTEVLSDESTSSLTISEDGETFIFDGEAVELEQVDAGDVIVGDASMAVPDGFLRKVVEVSEQDGKVIVETEDATLEDAIQDGSIFASQPLYPEDIRSTVLQEGVTMNVDPMDADALYFEYSLDKVLYDADEDLDTTNDQIVAKGKVSFESRFDINLQMKWFKLQSFYFANKITETADLTIESTLEYSIEKEVEIARHYFSPIKFWIGYVPVVFTPVLTVYVGVDGSVHAGITTGVSQEASLTAGLKYESGAWNPVWDFSNDIDFQLPTLSAGVEVKGYAGVQFSLLLYGVAGPYAKVNVYLLLEAEIGIPHWWKLWLGLEVPVGVEVKLLSRDIVSYEVTLFDFKWLLAQDNDPPNTPSIPSPTDGATDQSLDQDLSWIGGDPEEDAVTYDVYFEAGDSTPDVLVSINQAGTSYDPGTLDYNTQYYWQIVAWDEFDEKTVGPVWDFTTGDIPNQPPNIPTSPSPANGSTGQIIDPNLSWTGDDPDGDLLTYDVYFEAGDSTPDVLVSENQAGMTYDLGVLSTETHYYWQIIARDERGAITAGPIWNFTTGTGEDCPILLTLEEPVVEGKQITFDGSATSECSIVIHISWDWGDWTTGDEQSFPATHYYNSEFLLPYYAIVATAYGDLGNQAVMTTTATMYDIKSIMKLIPEGIFQMGCDPLHNDGVPCDEESPFGKPPDELPLHTVYLDDYYIDSYEVTNVEYKQCVTAGVCTTPVDYSSGLIQSYYDNPDYDSYPVIYVDWYQADAYCIWIGGRLPTEAEWEKAARGTSDTRAFPWGDQSPTCDLANFTNGVYPYGYSCVNNTSNNPYWSGRSPYDVLNMAGNVWEWVADWYDSGYYSVSPYSNPPGPDTGTYKVLRGGGYGSYSWEVRVPYRGNWNPTHETGTFGFRCAAPGE